jgi:NADPH-dependent ferric siderophore reductase
VDLLTLGRPDGDREAVRVPHELRRRVLEVLRVEHVTPRIRRVVLGGDGLEADFPFPRLAASDHVKVVLPDEATGELVVPDGPVRGLSGVAVRDYTVRRFDADTRELALDFVVHQHGPAGRWAAKAKPGDRLGVWGPRGSVCHPAGYARYLLLGDETALPALGRWLEDLPAGAEVTALVATEDPEDATYLDHPAVRWVAPGNLEEAVRALPAPDGDTYVWGAGEAGSLVPVRRYLRRELGLPKHQADVDGYWKRGEANFDHHAPQEE